MTAHRRPEIRWSDAEQGICRWCGEEILFDTGEKKGTINRRRRWHQACVDIYNASDPREARRRIRKRDRGRCADCRVDTYKVRRELRKIGRGRTRAIRERGYKPGQSFWELDHIIPLIDGGSHDDENLQSLCTPCHTRKTAEEARARATQNTVVESEAETPSRTSRANTKRVKSKAPSLEQLLEAADAVNARVAKALAKALTKPLSR
jgi:5-methylcytosine-specific restriction endonuclease McrA